MKILDSLVSAISPRAALDRKVARMALNCRCVI